MPASSPPANPTTQSPQTRDQGKPLPCIEFLKTHFEYGGVDQKGFDMLYRMIQMISAVGWEVHVIYQSKIATTRTVEKVKWNLDCILQGCSVFHSNMQKASTKAKDAAEKLPDVSDYSDVTLETKLVQWKWKLKTLHDPTGNDFKLFRMIAKHYTDAAFNRLVKLHRRKPGYGLGELVDRAFEVDSSLEGLWQIAREADRRVRVLHDTFSAAVFGEPSAKTRHTTENSKERLAPTIYTPSEPRTETVLPLSLCKSFGVAEEEAARQRQARISALSKADYATNAFADLHPLSARKREGPTTGTRRKNKSVPRVFTGSFSELENDLRSLELHKVRTPETVEEERSNVKVHHFGTTAVDSPCLSPSPPTLLQRREAISSKDTELQDRVLNGEVVTSRRPSTKGRAQTIENDVSLEEWLRQASQRHEMSQTPGFNAPSQRRREDSR